MGLLKFLFLLLGIALIALPFLGVITGSTAGIDNKIISIGLGFVIVIIILLLWRHDRKKRMYSKGFMGPISMKDGRKMDKETVTRIKAMQQS